MKLALMQPYFIPYIGYFQLLHSVDLFVSYDNAQFSKGGWVNRNRYRDQSEWHWASLSATRSHALSSIAESQYLNIGQEVGKLIKSITQHYPDTAGTEFICSALHTMKLTWSGPTSIATFNVDLLRILCRYLGVMTPIVSSSDVLTKQTMGVEFINEVCDRFKVTRYINSPGGRVLYDQEMFPSCKLSFVQTKPLNELFGKDEFNYSLSIVDLICRHPQQLVREMVASYELADSD
jgi:hypothetical protein